MVIDLESGQVLAHEWYSYDGPIEEACGGDALAGAKQQAAKEQADAAAQQAAIAKQRNDVQQPFETNLVNHGLPYLPQLLDYSNGTLAKAYSPMRATMNRNLAGFGDTLPSGFKTQTQTDFNSNEANAFDQNTINALQQNEATKENAAAQLNPLGFYGGSNSANQSILSAPAVQSGGVGNFLGGMASGLISAAGNAGGKGGFAGLF
jgi:hypothetical protein